MSAFDNFSKKELEDIVLNNDTWAQVLISLTGYNSHNKEVPTLKKKLDSLEIDYSHLDTNKCRRDKNKNRNKLTAFTTEEVLKKDSGFSQNTVRKRFKQITKDEDYKCAICGQEPFWNGKPLTLTLDHIDGNNQNHDVTNLRWLCPNCDRQTETFGRKHLRNENGEIIYQPKKPEKILCPICQKNLMCYNSTMCKDCRKKYDEETGRDRKFIVSKEDLKKMIRVESFLAIGKKFNVSDNAIRRRCKKFNLPFTRTEINKYSDEEWEKL